MNSENLNKAFDSDMSGEKRNLRVHLINPAVENPWGSHEEYLEERSKSLELRQKQIDAINSMEKSSWIQTITFIITIIGVLAPLKDIFAFVLSFI